MSNGLQGSINNDLSLSSSFRYLQKHNSMYDSVYYCNKKSSKINLYFWKLCLFETFFVNFLKISRYLNKIWSKNSWWEWFSNMVWFNGYKVQSLIPFWGLKILFWFSTWMNMKIRPGVLASIQNDSTTFVWNL